MQPETSGIKTWQWVVTVVVVIVLIIIGIMVFGNKSKAPTTPDEVPTDIVQNTNGTNSVIVADQYPGNVVFVSSVELAAPGWVVIHKDNSGQPGAIIGQTYLPAGLNPAKVTLSSAIVDSGTYYAVLYSDNGDQKFDATIDLPLKDTNNNIIMRVFHGSITAGSNIKG